MALPGNPDVPDAHRTASRPGIDRHRPSRLARSLSKEEILGEIVPDLTRRIIDAVHPSRVILFGSAARGKMGPHSDLDVLVVVANDVDQNRASKDIYRSLRGLGMASDVLVISECDLEIHGQDPWLVYHFALSEGKELYRAEVQA
ncbi:nucleotidyltransferase domain-containing protein [Geothrix sp. 21YS21S-2]|uniref:nucleotidyltransferase domain-containing protein n=1 Tax=Geothrix sp. 21YS21S-2 TaxID=3068893 RepID=UPI0027BAB2FA|nr:nucleotidyltransferase domain-containing protein [Geothrix sp. 21YS21S-2]